MGDIKFYSPVDFDDTSSGVTIEGNLIANANVGIGTTSPTSPLHVVNTTGGWSAYINNDVGTGTQSGLLLDAGSSSSDFAMYVRNAAGSSSLFSIKGNGNVENKPQPAYPSAKVLYHAAIEDTLW